MKSLTLQFKGETIYLFTGVITATVKRLDVSGFFCGPPEEDLRKKITCITETLNSRLQRTKERRDTSYPRGGTPLYDLYGDVPLYRGWFSSSLS